MSGSRLVVQTPITNQLIQMKVKSKISNGKLLIQQSYEAVQEPISPTKIRTLADKSLFDTKQDPNNLSV